MVKQKKKITKILFKLVIGLAVVIVISKLFFYWQIEKELVVTVIEASEVHSATVIFLHGLGDNASTWQTRLLPIVEQYPQVKFIIPQAPIIPVAMLYHLPIWSWYNMKGNVRKILEIKEDSKSLLKSVSKLEKIIQKEIDGGIIPEKIMVMGHSQGGAVSLALGLTTEYPLGAIVAFNSFLPCRTEIFTLAKKNRNTFFLVNNSGDSNIPIEVGRESFKLLKEAKNKVDFLCLKNNYHYPSTDELQMIFDLKIKNLLAEKAEF